LHDEERGASRRLLWEDLQNARDLGGLPAAAGRTRRGAVVRTDGLGRLRAAGRAAMLGYGVATIIDLRAPRELMTHPNPLRDHPGFRNLPFLDDVALDEVGKFDIAADSYLWQVESQAARIAGILREIAGAPAGGVVVHCAAGKDRTGIIAALLLTVAGADRDVIAEDYSLSSEWLASELNRALEAEPDRERRLRLNRMYESRPELILSLLAALDRRHGSVTGYLAGAGVAEDVLELLRHRLL
jgi:protein-tyrosine phosphatase